MKKEYTNGEITVIWQPDLCIHSEKCARGLATVFNPNARPWINMAGADADKIVAQVNQCPSGALSILKEVTMSESKETRTAIDVLKNGPVKVHGPCTVTQSDGSMQELDKDIFLCRCGHSANKPFCDGSHKREGFEG